MCHCSWLYAYASSKLMPNKFLKVPALFQEVSKDNFPDGSVFTKPSGVSGYKISNQGLFFSQEKSESRGLGKSGCTTIFWRASSFFLSNNTQNISLFRQTKLDCEAAKKKKKKKMGKWNAKGSFSQQNCKLISRSVTRPRGSYQIN